jgi:hypothetical protein
MIERTKLAAYYLCEYSGNDNTLALWYCAEDIASLFERCQIYTEDGLQNVLRLHHSEREYKAFIRHVSFRLHLYLGIMDELYNWHLAERLLNNPEWRAAIIFLASEIHKMREGSSPNW